MTYNKKRQHQNIGYKEESYLKSALFIKFIDNKCTNLLVPVCVSSSHIAFGSIRMEPVFMILGQSAAAAASLAIDYRISLQDLDYSLLKEKLLSEKVILGVQ